MDLESLSTPQAPPTWFDRTWRWWVLFTLVLATVLNYLDRLTLNTAADPICAELQIDMEARGKMLAAFVYAYAFSHLFIGFILDRIRGIRWFFPTIVVGWSITNALVGFATTYDQIIWLRRLLGFWESANFPLCLLIIARVFPMKERSFAVGVFNSGAVLATLIAPKTMIWLSNSSWELPLVGGGWRLAFILTGSLGVLWLIPWLLIFRRPEQRALHWPRGNEPAASAGKPDARPIARAADSQESSGWHPAIGQVVLIVLVILAFAVLLFERTADGGWQLALGPNEALVCITLCVLIMAMKWISPDVYRRAFGSPAFLGVVIAGMGYAPAWYFMSTWLPSYFTTQWNVKYNQALGNTLTIIYFCQDIGLWIGGGLVWFLASKGMRVLSARKTIIVMAYVMMMSAVLILPRTESMTICVILLALFTFGMAVWQSHQQAFKQDVAVGMVATVAALVGFFETGFSAFIVDKVGQQVQTAGGFNAVFGFFAVSFTIALLAVLILLRSKWLRADEMHKSNNGILSYDEQKNVSVG